MKKKFNVYNLGNHSRIAVQMSYIFRVKATKI